MMAAKTRHIVGSVAPTSIACNWCGGVADSRPVDMWYAETMAGYSGTPLLQKLGFDRLEWVVVLHAPRGYQQWLGVSAPVIQTRFNHIPSGPRLGSSGSTRGIHWFATTERELTQEFPTVKKHLAKDGSLWISWPKKTSRLAGDIDENSIRRIGLAQGLVDVKVAAISDDWSGLKFVYRLKDR